MKIDALMGCSARFVLCAWITGATLAVAQPAFPSKPIRVIVPFPTGGLGDITGRIISQKLGELLDQRVIVDNRPGADEIIGAELLVRSPPDGYTLLMATAAQAINPSLHRKLPFDPASDFAPVTLTLQFPYLILVHPSVQARSARELIALAKAYPGKLTVGTSATLPQLASAWLFGLAGVSVTHVPYKGAGPVITDLVGGHVDAVFAAPAGPLPLVQSGRIRAVAVTSRTRSDMLPDVPTVIEGGVPDYEILGWHGALVHGRTPPELVDRLNAALVAVLRMPDIKKQFSDRTLQAVGNSPGEFAQFMKAERAKWSKAVAASGIRPE